MDFRDYQQKAVETAIYPAPSAVVYPALGLANEAGEVLGKIKKIIRDGNSDYWSNAVIIGDEIGDVLWYIAALCDDLGLEMNDIAKANLNKLASRKERGVLQGSGDNR